MRRTFTVSVPLVSFTAKLFVVKLRLPKLPGPNSLSMISSTALAKPSFAPPVGFESDSNTDSSNSGATSLMIGIVNVRLICPDANSSVPLRGR